jgi:hypothetical protein
MRKCPTCGGEWSDDDSFCPNDGTALRSSWVGNLTGTILAKHYSIDKRLGEGAMGVVQREVQRRGAHLTRRS